jgi:hypothetical protein
MGGAIHLAQIIYGTAMSDFIIREYQPQDFDAVTILWRLAREKSIPEFQRQKGHFFYEDREYFREKILQRDKVWVAEADGSPGGFHGDGERFHRPVVCPSRSLAAGDRGGVVEFCEKPISRAFVAVYFTGQRLRARSMKSTDSWRRSSVSAIRRRTNRTCNTIGGRIPVRKNCPC